MASKNTVREYESYSYYHIYNRGVNKRRIFLDTEDRKMFLAILTRHLGTCVIKDSSGRPYDKYNEIELLAYCLMTNHFHFLIYQKADERAFTKFLRSLCTAYSQYFNRKYDRVGHLFQDRFKAIRVMDDSYYLHISRYIHLNPASPWTYKWSSLPNYLGFVHEEWLQPERVLSLFAGKDGYKKFVADYVDNRAMINLIKKSLANE